MWEWVKSESYDTGSTLLKVMLSQIYQMTKFSVVGFYTVSRTTNRFRLIIDLYLNMQKTLWEEKKMMVVLGGKLTMRYMYESQGQNYWTV